MQTNDLQRVLILTVSFESKMMCLIEPEHGRMCLFMGEFLLDLSGKHLM